MKRPLDQLDQVEKEVDQNAGRAQLFLYIYVNQKLKIMKKVLSERSKKIVDNTIDEIKKGEMSVCEGYNKFVSNMFGSNAYEYFINNLLQSMVQFSNAVQNVLMSLLSY